MKTEDAQFVASAHLTSAEKYVQSIETHGHRLTSDEPEQLGGTNQGPAPFSLLASALGSCTSITLRMYAERKGWELGTIRVDLRVYEDAGRHRIERVLRFSAPLDDAQRARLVEIAGKTPVTRALLAGVAIETTVGD